MGISLLSVHTFCPVRGLEVVYTRAHEDLTYRQAVLLEPADKSLALAPPPRLTPPLTCTLSPRVRGYHPGTRPHRRRTYVVHVNPPPPGPRVPVLARVWAKAPCLLRQAGIAALGSDSSLARARGPTPAGLHTLLRRFRARPPPDRLVRTGPGPWPRVHPDLPVQATPQSHSHLS